MSENTERPKGIAGAEAILQREARYPRLFLKAGDRGVFHFLTSGNDDYFGATGFHIFGDSYQNQRLITCVKDLTFGDESCKYCEEGHTEKTFQFATWVYCHYILHLGDNPDEQGERWKAVKLGDRTLFQESVGKPLLIKMKAGRNQAWFKQFTAYWTAFGNLQHHLYRLHRQGSGVSDTNYTLEKIKDMPISEEHAKISAELPTVEQVFRQTLDYAPSTSVSAAPRVLDEAVVLPAADDLDELEGAVPEVSEELEDLM